MNCKKSVEKQINKDKDPPKITTMNYGNFIIEVTENVGILSSNYYVIRYKNHEMFSFCTAYLDNAVRKISAYLEELKQELERARVGFINDIHYWKYDSFFRRIPRSC